MKIKTNDYSAFKSREDNRSIDRAHVNRLIMSIQARNLLDMAPMQVDENMYIIDGQHRLAAARKLNVDIWYEVVKNSKPEDIISMNISKSWGINDFFNYYVANKFPEYMKLEEYIKKNQINLRLGIVITSGRNHENSSEFRLGQYKFEGEQEVETLDLCHQTVDYIKKMNGFSLYASSNRFWMALIKLVRHENFQMEKWITNLSRMVHKFGPKVSQGDYLDMFMNCYNWKTAHKIEFSD